MVKKSRNTFYFFIEDRYFLFNSYTLKMYEVEKAYIEAVVKDRTSIGEQISEIDKELIYEGFLIDENKYENIEADKIQRYEIASRATNSYISFLRISLTEKCNMACKYCFVSNEFREKKETMSTERFLNIMNDFISHNEGNKVYVQYFGGEPLIKMDLIELGNNMLTDAFSEGRIESVYQEIVTNGTLLDNEKIRYFKKNKVKLTISLDGRREINDINRIYANGQGTFEEVARWCSMLRKANGYLSVLLTPNEDNICILSDSIKYLIENLGVTEMSINAPQPCKNGWDIDGAIFAQEIQKCILYCQERGVSFNSPANNMLYLLQHHELQRYSCMNFSKDNKTNIYGVYIGSDGMISNCVVKRTQDKYTCFNDALNSILEENWVFQPSTLVKCTHCPLMNVCGGPCTMEQQICKEGYNPEKCKFMLSMLRWVLVK